MGKNKPPAPPPEESSSRVAAVTEIHNVEPDAPETIPPPEAPRVRWIVPRGYGRPTAHAMVGDAAKRTACGGIATDGAQYPPAPSLPKCEACVAALKATATPSTEGVTT